MIRIRFHGRGGHGIKTASRIVGTAAFLAGYQVQDSPVYGAERRGAAVVAFTRFSEDPILERGVIEQPDLIVIGDETLLDSPGVLAGQESVAAIFLNANSDEILLKKFPVHPHVVAWDVTSRTLEILQVPSALSTGLASAAVRLVGQISEDHLLVAVRQELEALQIPEERIVKNLQLADEVFRALPSLNLQPRHLPEEIAPEEIASEGATSETISPVDYEGLLMGTPSILNTGNADQRHTGSWRFERPVIDTDQCSRCGLCFIQCPDGAIALDKDGYPVIDYDHCKGCMLCQTLCPVHAITTQKEVRTW